MISNTKAFYNKAMEYQTKRGKLVDEHEKKVKQMEPYKGSQGYDDYMEEYEKKFDAEYATLQSEYERSLNTILDGMEHNINKRGMKAPTAEQVNLINMLKMKENITEQDCDRVANMVSDNPIALDVVQEVAHKHGISKPYASMCKEMSNKAATNVVNGIRHDLNDWIKFDTSYASRYFSDHYTKMYGDDGQNHLFKRKPFEDEDGCYKELAGISGDQLKLFADAVNGGIDDN